MTVLVIYYLAAPFNKHCPRGLILVTSRGAQKYLAVYTQVFLPFWLYNRHQAVTHNRSRPPLPYTAPFPVRSSSPPRLSLCMQRPTCMRLECLGAYFVPSPKL